MPVESNGNTLLRVFRTSTSLLPNVPPLHRPNRVVFSFSYHSFVLLLSLSPPLGSLPVIWPMRIQPSATTQVARRHPTRNPAQGTSLACQPLGTYNTPCKVRSRGTILFCQKRVHNLSRLDTRPSRLPVMFAFPPSPFLRHPPAVATLLRASVGRYFETAKTCHYAALETEAETFRATVSRKPSRARLPLMLMFHFLFNHF